jgi:hypothetical protein
MLRNGVWHSRGPSIAAPRANPESHPQTSHPDGVPVQPQQSRVPNVRTYPSLVQAQHAAEFLRSNGIIASVLGGVDAFGAVSTLGGRFTVIIAAPAEDDRARGLLDEFDSEAGTTDLDSQSVPDLRLLDPRTRALCPACAAPLPLDATVVTCPACAAPANVVEVLLARYGPELLSDCYPPSHQDIPDDVIDEALLACAACEYPLCGLSAVGSCPECGHTCSQLQAGQRARAALVRFAICDVPLPFLLAPAPRPPPPDIPSRPPSRDPPDAAHHR